MHADLFSLFQRGVRLRIRKCPRCGGFIYWPYLLVRTGDREFYRDKLKCFSCARLFVLVRNGREWVWKRWPESPEAIDHVTENPGDGL